MTLSSTLLRAGDNLRPVRGDTFRGFYGRLFGNLSEWRPNGGAASDTIEHLWNLAEQIYAQDAADNDNIPSGYTYLGQLINHDLTFDASSSLEEKNDPVSLPNFRTPRFDLDGVYGRGPQDQPYLYAGNAKLIVGANQVGEPDLPRSPFTGSSLSSSSRSAWDDRRPALIGDTRNDENLIISQLHLAIIQFHNRAVNEGMSFEEAQHFTRWHYQWIAINDFLKRFCGADLVDELLGKHGSPVLRFYNPMLLPHVPVEFSMAAYRVGHSMIRPEYSLSEAFDKLRGGVQLSIFSGVPEDSLEGGRVLPPGWSVQWSCFVETGGQKQTELNFSRCLGPNLALPLKLMPIPELPDNRLRSLAFRTLMRGWRTALPSGQSIAKRMGESVIEGNDPLWYYLLKEAAEKGTTSKGKGKGPGRGGRQLGPVGARLVAEVFIGLLAADPTSYYAVDPNWKPHRSMGNPFGLREFLAWAGAPISRADWERIPRTSRPF